MIKDQSYKSNWCFVFFAAIFLSFISLAIGTSFYWIALIPFVIVFFYFGWQHLPFVFFLLIFSLPWSVEFNLNSSLGTDFPDEQLMWLTSALFLAYFIFRPSDAAAKWKHPLVILLFFYFGWLIISVIFSTDSILSVKFFLAKSWYIVAFVFTPLLLFNNKKRIQLTGLTFLVSLLFVVVIILYRHAFLGFRFSDVNEAVSPFFRNHVNYSAMMVCSVPVLIAAYQLSKRFRTSIVIAIIIVLIALFFSYARGAWLALILAAVSYYLIKKKRLVIAFIMSSLLILASLLWISRSDRYLRFENDYRTTIFHKNFEEHLIATYKLKDVSTAERFNRWIAGVRMIKDKPLTGFGPNTFYNNYKPYMLPVFKTWVSDNEDHSTVHNYFLLTTIEQGLPGLLFILLLTGALLFYSEKIYHRVHDKFYKNAAMACGVMLVMILTVNFLSDLVETDKVGSLFFLCLATLVAIDVNTKRQTTPKLTE
jgi:O-antigen ligase